MECCTAIAFLLISMLLLPMTRKMERMGKRH
jgi:hypothetical protein